jgi:hypothetical protein
LIEGTDLLGPSQGDSLVDGAYPNDLGHKAIGEGLAARIPKITGLELNGVIAGPLVEYDRESSPTDFSDPTDSQG